jgi:hypothetical protein
MYCLGSATWQDPIRVGRRRHPILPLLVALTLGAGAAAGCGNSADNGTAPPRGAAALKGDPALARTPRRAGEILLRGDASPRTHGPIALDGRYLVRFEQYAPEDPRLDFRNQTAFVADLERQAGVPAVRLFRTARASGQRTVTAHGRFLVDVSFGDFPYVLRLTPVRE